MGCPIEYQKGRLLGHGFLKKKRGDQHGVCEWREKGQCVSALRTLTGTTSDDAFPAFFFGERGHEIVSSSDLEAEDFLEVLAFEPYLVAKLCAEVLCENEGCFFDDLVYFGVQDEPKVIGSVV